MTLHWDLSYIIREFLEISRSFSLCLRRNGKNWGYKDDMGLRLTDDDMWEKGKMGSITGDGW